MRPRTKELQIYDPKIRKERLELLQNGAELLAVINPTLLLPYCTAMGYKLANCLGPSRPYWRRRADNLI